MSEENDHNPGVNTMSVHEAKAHFSDLLRRVEAGETIVVTRHNSPVAEIKPILVKPIELGAFEGEFVIPTAAFAPLTQEEMREWYGE